MPELLGNEDFFYGSLLRGKTGALISSMKLLNLLGLNLQTLDCSLEMYESWQNA